jgi:hypothetical protein
MLDDPAKPWHLTADDREVIAMNPTGHVWFFFMGYFVCKRCHRVRREVMKPCEDRVVKLDLRENRP